METKKMSLANMEGKLRRSDMKRIMAGAEEEEIGGVDRCWNLPCNNDIICHDCYGWFVACGCNFGRCQHG